MLRKYKFLLASSVVFLGAMVTAQQANSQYYNTTANNGTPSGNQIISSSNNVQNVYDWNPNAGTNCSINTGVFTDCAVFPSTGSVNGVRPLGVALGDGNAASGGAVAVGSQNKVGGTHGSYDYADFAFGNYNIATGGYSTAMGYGNYTTGVSSIAIGTVSQATAKGAIVMGRQSTASGEHAIMIGSAGIASASESIALGHWSNAGLAGSVALGANSVTGTTAPTGLGYATKKAAPVSVVSVGSSTLQRRIINVADGSADGDAVNVAQLRTVADNTSDYFGGGANVGEGKAPTYIIQGNTYNDVGGLWVDLMFLSRRSIPT